MKFFTITVLACLTGISLTSGSQVIASGCQSHINKNAKVECLEDDTDCKTNKAAKSVLDKKVRS